MKSSTEILQDMDKERERREELKRIRKERKMLNGKDKPQKRKVEIIEYEDGTYSLEGYAYNLPLQMDEVEHAFKAWLDNSLENGM